VDAVIMWIFQLKKRLGLSGEVEVENIQKNVLIDVIAGVLLRL